MHGCRMEGEGTHLLQFKTEEIREGITYNLGVGGFGQILQAVRGDALSMMHCSNITKHNCNN